MMYRLKSAGRTCGRLLDLSIHNLNISVNTFAAIEAVLSPTNDSFLVSQLLQLICNSQVHRRVFFFYTVFIKLLKICLDPQTWRNKVAKSQHNFWFCLMQFPNIWSDLTRPLQFIRHLGFYCASFRDAVLLETLK